MNLLTPSFDLILVLPVFYSSMLFVTLLTGCAVMKLSSERGVLPTFVL